jgi:hypothetical protein
MFLDCYQPLRLSLLVVSGNVAETQGIDCFRMFGEIWVDSYVLMYMHYQELMKSVGSHGSLSLLFSMKVTLCEGLSQGDGCTCC